MTGDLPQMFGYQGASSTYGLGNLGQSVGTASSTPFIGALFAQGEANPLAQQVRRLEQQEFKLQAFREAKEKLKELKEATKESEVANSKRRLVQVFICDPDENIPLDDCLLYRRDQHLTDATDQELFFEIDIKGTLEKHNAKRVKLVNKKVKERVEHLEPAKVRDLKMVVVTVAEF